MADAIRGGAALSWFLASFFLAGCAAQTPPPTPELVRVFVTSAAAGEMTNLYACSTPATAILLSDPASAELTLRLGAPDPLTTPAYQIGTEDVLVVVPTQNSLQALSQDQVRGIFLGQVTDWQTVGGAPGPIQVWTYASGQDIQQIFLHLVMHDQPITSQARLAVSVQNMSDSLASSSGSIGFLPRSLVTSALHSVYQAASEPVLAISPSQPQGAVRALIACLQSK